MVAGLKIPKGLVISILVIVGSAIYFTFSPEDSVFFPKCPFHYLTGFDCPGCGSQRAIHNLLHLNIKDAFFFNPLLVFSVPYVIMGIYMEYAGGKQKHPRTRQILMGRNATYIILVTVVVFWIGRNLVKFI